MTLMPFRKVCNVAKSTAALLSVGAFGAAAVYAGSTDQTICLALGATTFLGSVAGNAAFDGIQKLIRACRERPQERVDENHIILRALRHAQIEALIQLRVRWNEDRGRDADERARTALDDAFDHRLGTYIEEEEASADTLTWEAMPDPEVDDLNALRASAASFDAALALRHGIGLALDEIGGPARLAVWTELQQNVGPEIPGAFRARFDAPDGGFFALFVGAAAARLRDNAEFERIWNAEQVATIRHLAGTTADTVGKLEDQAAAATNALKQQGILIEAIAGRVDAMSTALVDIRNHLFGDDTWLHFDIVIRPEGWLRFSPYNPAVPFQGRREILAELDAFLNDDRPFAWWGATGQEERARLAWRWSFACVPARAAGGWASCARIGTCA